MALSGVRSSWDMLARNKLLAWLAVSAASLAFFKACSVCLRLLISRLICLFQNKNMRIMPMVDPPAINPHFNSLALLMPCSNFIARYLLRIAVFSSSVILASALLIIELNSGQSRRTPMDRICSLKGLGAATLRSDNP